MENNSESCSSTTAKKPKTQLLASRIALSRNYSRSKRREICPHCNLLLCNKTLKRHKALFFSNGRWIKADSSQVEDIDSDTEGGAAVTKAILLFYSYYSILNS